MIKKNFATGLVIILPAAITLIIVYFLFNFFTKPFAGMIEGFLNADTLTEYSAAQLELFRFLSRIAILLLLIGITIVVGMLTRIYALRALGRLGEYLIGKTPIVNKVYHAAREVVKTLFDSSSAREKFSKVVLVPYPYKETLSIGLVPAETLPEGSDAIHADRIPVFVPGCPNPTMGFVMIFNKTDLHFIDLSVEEALKLVISLGVVWK